MNAAAFNFAFLNPFFSGSAVTAVWAMIFAICMTLAAVHGLFWLRQRKALDSLMFAILAICTGLIAAAELRMMRAETPHIYETICAGIRYLRFLALWA